MKKNGAQAVHCAVGMVVGYPPCPFILHFRTFNEKQCGLKVVVDTLLIPEKYCKTHSALETWNTPESNELVKPTLADESGRSSYDGRAECSDH